MTPLEQAIAIARAVRDAGGRALIVGGWVRDRIMGQETTDIDLEVFRLARPAKDLDIAVHAAAQKIRRRRKRGRLLRDAQHRVQKKNRGANPDVHVKWFSDAEILSPPGSLLRALPAALNSEIGIAFSSALRCSARC